MRKPRRIRLSRAKGFRLADVSDDYKIVSRPSRWGNPFMLEWARLKDPKMTDAEAREFVVAVFRAWLVDDAYRFGALVSRRTWILEHLHELRGKDLACWCPGPADGQEDHCHARVLLDLCNTAGVIR